MNQLKGVISEIHSFEGLSFLYVTTPEQIVLKVIILETNIDNPIFKIDDFVILIFKETELILSTETTISTSIDNQLKCMVTAIKKGVILTQISLQFGSIKLQSIITTSSFKNLSLHINEPVLALIQANQISLMHD